MRSILLVFVCLFSKISSAENLLFQRILYSESQYVSLFDSINDYINKKEQIGHFTKQDKAEILAFLKSKKIDLNSKMSPARFHNNQFSWGLIKFEVVNNNTIKTAKGTIVRLDKNLSASEVFKKSFNTFQEGRNISSSWSLFSSTANAQKSNYVNGVDAALSIASTYIVHGIYGTLAAGLTVVCGSTLMPIEALMYAARKWQYDGQVECRNGFYDFLNYPSYSAAMIEDFKEVEKLNLYMDRGPVFSAVGGAMAATCVGPFKSIFSPKDSNRSAKNDYFPKPGEKKVTQSVPDEVMQAAGVQKEAPCSKENIDKIKSYMDKEAQTVEAEVKAFMRSKETVRKVDTNPSKANR